MHNNIIEPVLDYDFSKVQLGIPVSHPNSTFVSRIFLTNKPLYIQTPKCTTKNGIVKSGKKIYCDLMFSSDDSIFIDWVTNLELKCQTLIGNKSESWFETQYTRDEIETAFSSPLKIYKSGKCYLLRVNIKPNMKIYNDLNVEVSFDDIDETVNMITVIEFYGIKFTSRNFQMEVELKQSMIVSKDEFLGNCFINRTEPVAPTQTPTRVYAPREPDDPPQLLSNEPTNERTNERANEPTNQRTKEEEKEQTSEPIKESNSELTKEKESNSEPELEEPINEVKEPDIQLSSIDLELSEFEFDSERLEESAPLHLKRPIDQYYKEYNDLIEQANKLKKSLTKIYSNAKYLKETHSLNVDNIEQYIYSDIDISDNENDDSDDNV